MRPLVPCSRLLIVFILAFRAPRDESSKFRMRDTLRFRIHCYSDVKSNDECRSMNSGVKIFNRRRWPPCRGPCWEGALYGVFRGKCLVRARSIHCILYLQRARMYKLHSRLVSRRLTMLTKYLAQNQRSEIFGDRRRDHLLLDFFASQRVLFPRDELSFFKYEKNDVSLFSETRDKIV